MKISLYTLTSSLHDKLAVDAVSREFLTSIENELGYGFELRSDDFSSYGQRDLDVIFILSNPSIHSLTNSYYGNTMYIENQSLPRESSENGGLSFVDSYLYRDISWTDNSFYTEKRTVNKHLSIVY